MAAEIFSTKRVLIPRCESKCATRARPQSMTAVIDCGLARVARFDSHRGINTLLVEKISAAIARKAGEEIWKRFQIPVYLYEAAASTPERQNLENIRRGQFEGLREAVAADPARQPDFGEARLHPTAGATVVGARKALIAYNVFLNTTDVDVAKKIAKAVRYSSGGLRYVKGSGFEVRGLAQVSMNLTDFEQTPIARVFEFVKREAARYGVTPLSTEIV